MTQELRTFLTFQGGTATAALDLYREVFADFELIEIDHYGPGEVGSEGTVKAAKFRLAGATSAAPTAPSAMNGASPRRCHSGSTATTAPSSSDSSTASATGATCSCRSTTTGSVPVSAGSVIATG